MYVSLSYFDTYVVLPPEQLIELKPQKEHTVGHGILSPNLKEQAEG